MMHQTKRLTAPKVTRIGLAGYGKAGKAVANVLNSDPRFELRWIARRSADKDQQTHPESDIPIVGLDRRPFADLSESAPVDMLVDFSSRESIHAYGEEMRKRGIALASAISAHSEGDLEYARSLGLTGFSGIAILSKV